MMRNPSTEPKTSRGVRLVVTAAAAAILVVLMAETAAAISSTMLTTPPSAAVRLQMAPTGDRLTETFLGISVASAGDVNGDGYADVIVGELGYFPVLRGRALVYYGGPGADAVADLTLTGAVQGDRFGIWVSGAGDVNGDGYGDVIVGASGNSTFGVTNAAYVYYGGPGADAVADLTLTGTAAFEGFGISVSSAGDMNGDGYADVIVGTYVGRAYVYYGGPTANTVADLTLTGAVAGDGFGFSLSSAGDVNGDGYSDVIVGAYAAGRAYVYYGGPGADDVADLTLTGQVAGDDFGFSVSGAGDVNGDGYADVIVGAPGPSRAYVYYGSSGADAVPDLTLTGQAANDVFGYSVSSAGDVNRDGYADLIVGAFSADIGGINAGRAYAFYGGPAADALADATWTGTANGVNFGNSVSGAGDVNGDGFDDVIVGAPAIDIEGAGAAYLYDFNRYFVLSPNGGETWNVGAMKTISWLGAEPADLWLSVDGGANYVRLETGVGGAELNSVPVLVPHQPTHFARVQVTPTNTSIRGRDRSDSLFTIQTSVALLALLAAPAPQGGSGAVVTWRTDPGPEELAGYRLERGSRSGSWATVVRLTKETSFLDASAGPATRYRLFAVNGLGEELMLGETSFRPLASLAAWPLPYRSGNLSISFATHGGLGGGTARVEVVLFNSLGRLVRTITSGQFDAGYQSAVWDGRDTQGRRAAAGVYFLRVSNEGTDRTMKFVVVR